MARLEVPHILLAISAKVISANSADHGHRSPLCWLRMLTLRTIYSRSALFALFRTLLWLLQGGVVAFCDVKCVKINVLDRVP